MLYAPTNFINFVPMRTALQSLGPTMPSETILVNYCTVVAERHTQPKRCFPCECVVRQMLVGMSMYTYLYIP